MKGRLNSTLWLMVTIDVVALFVVLWLAYSAGEQGKLPITDFGGLGQGSGLKLCLHSSSRLAPACGLLSPLATAC